MRTELITIGTELLLGDILDTNTKYLAQELAKRGFEVLHTRTVGDNPKRLERAIREALAESDLVITTGGLGPTADDITKEIAAKVMEKPLLMHEESLQRVQDYFAQSNREMPESNQKQALMPEGAIVFRNDNGTAPGCGIERDGKIVICLPGPPYEMKPMFQKQVSPYLETFTKGTLVSHQIRTFGIGESRLAEIAGDLLDMSNPTVAPYAKFSESYLRVTALAKSKKEAEELIAPVVDELVARLGDVVYGSDENSLEERVVYELRRRGLTLALAESCTGGLIAKRITDIAGASDVFGWGIVSYAPSAKEALLSVKRETIHTYGIVSKEVAKEMATGVRSISGADYGFGITGSMGPGPDGSGNRAGLSYMALASATGVKVLRLYTGRPLRRDNRYIAASNGLNMIRQELLKRK